MASATTGEAISALVVGPATDLEAMIPGTIPVVVDRAEGAAQAITRLARKPYELILIDHTEQGEITEEQLAYLRALPAMQPAAKTIVLAAHTTSRKVIEALRHGVAAYFTKPIDPSAVQEAITQVLANPNWSDGIEILSAEPAFVSVRLRCRLSTAERLAQFLNELPCGLSGEERIELSTAFREMLMNAIEHGGHLNENSWVRVSRVRTQRAIVYILRDPGPGFSRSDLKHAAISNPPEDPMAHLETRAAENMRPGGFGILITSLSIDEVIYSQKGNEVVLIKYLD